MAIHYKKDLIYEHLRREIMDKTLLPGSKLPRETELAKRLGVSHVTLRSSLARLEAEGLIDRMHGVGNFVSATAGCCSYLLVLPDQAELVESPSRYIVEGIEEKAREKAFLLEKFPASWLSQFTTEDYTKMLAKHHIRGIIYETAHAIPSPKLVELLKTVSLPVVIPHGGPFDAERTGFLVLRTNERNAFGDAFRYLAQLGHRRIAALLLRVPGEEASLFRGFRETELVEFYRYNGLESGEHLIRIVETSEQIRQTARELMLGPIQPTAFVCHSDRVAMRVFSSLKELNIRIPQEVSIMGYNNYPGCQLLDPPLCTIDTNLQECGKAALEKLITADDWYKPGITPPEILTPYKIIERDSVGPAPGNE